jgi:transmembrane sensor
MARIPRFLGFFGQRGEKDLSHPRLDELLDSQAHRLHDTNPDTARQWQYLHVLLQRSSTPAKARTRAGVFRLLNPALAYGGVVAMVIIIAGVFWLNRSSVRTYETARGQQSSIVLSDSSVVTLNHTSRLIVESRPFDATRRVSLKGEAFFHVRKNGSPFIVTTDVGTVRVLGTRFDVQVRGGQLVVGVVNGSVRVSAQREGRDSSVVLTAGQIAACSQAGFPGTPAPLPFAEYPGWTEGKFLFYRTSLQSACREIESRFDVEVHIQNPRAGGETITGVVDGGSAETALAALSNLTGSNFRHEGNAYILY